MAANNDVKENEITQASAQATLANLKEIRVVTTDGSSKAYGKADFMAVIAAGIKSYFSSIAAGNIAGILTSDSGKAGISALADVAQVLGVDSEIMYNVYNNLNDIIKPCRMLLLPGSQTYTNAPSQFTGNSTEGVLVVFPFTTNVANPRIGQFILSNIGFFLRFKSSGAWSNWIKVSNA